MPKAVLPEHGPWYTPAQSATYLQCSLRTIHRWIELGTLPTHRVGSRIVRIHRDDLDAVMGRVSA